MLCTGNAAKADRLRRGTKAKDKKYMKSEAYADVPSATLSTKPSSSPYLQQLQQQNRHQPKNAGDRWEEEAEHRELSNDLQNDDDREKLSNKDVHVNENEIEKEHIAHDTGEASPLENHAQEDLGENFFPMPPILLEDLEGSNRVYTEPSNGTQHLGTQFFDLV